MKYWYQKPHQSIAEYIRTVLILEGCSSSYTMQQPIFTNGMPALLCRTEKDAAGSENIVQLTLFGKCTPPGCWAINNNTTVVIYFFKPFALSGLFNIPAAKLLKKPIDLHNWNAHTTNALRTQLIYAASTERKIEVLDNLLIHQFHQNKRECEIIKYATDQIMCDPTPEILSAILKDLKLGERSFQRIFKKYVGISANQYRRICQFQLSFTQVRTKQFNKLTDVAYDNGFSDQSHFIRSFREFTHISPNTYLKNGLSEKDQ